MTLTWFMRHSMSIEFAWVPRGYQNKRANWSVLHVRCSVSSLGGVLVSIRAAATLGVAPPRLVDLEDAAKG